MKIIPAHPDFLNADEYAALVERFDRVLIEHGKQCSKGTWDLRDHFQTEVDRLMDADPSREGSMIEVPTHLKGHDAAAFVSDLWTVLNGMLQPMPSMQKESAVLRLLFLQVLINLTKQASIAGAELSSMDTVEVLAERAIAEQGIES